MCKAFEDHAPYSPEAAPAPSENYDKDLSFKPLRELDLKDNFMFAKVMSDKSILKEFLQIVLDFKISRIEMAQYERTLFPKIDSKSIRLDIYADDDINRKYCVEMQAYVEYNIGRRSRYYQSVIDIDSLSKGKNYKDLSDTFVIFICTYDPFKLGMQKYIFEKRCVNAPKDLSINDGVSTIILTDNDGDPVINEFFSYVKNSTDEEAARSHSKLIKLLNDKVQKVRFDPALEVEYMKFQELQREQFSRGYDSGMQQGIAQGVQQGIAQGTESATLNIIKAMLDNSVPDTQICQYTGCTPAYLSKVKDTLNN